ncbi:MAG: DUF494 family protein [Candidatus Krumholzibacteria bacterium]|nr:DUF494 family protein [Candidatus Krumholzibacteria bacterium]
MKQRVREIISWIIENGSEELFEQGAIIAVLEDLGYSGEEIDQAFSLLDVDSPVDLDGCAGGFAIANRVFSGIEQNLLRVDAQGWLLWMHRSGRLSQNQLNLVIESAGIECHTPATIDEIMEIASRYVPVAPGRGERRAPEADCCN